MKNLTHFFTLVLILPAFVSTLFAQGGKELNNTLTKDEIDAGWQLLWDGQTSNGWRSFNKPGFPATGWEMKDGILTIIPPAKNSFVGTGGDIITDKTFNNFELSVDFMYVPGANSGIKYFIDGKTNVGCEYQILDDKLHPDAKAGINGNRTLASLYDLIPASKDKKDNGPDTWNTAKIIVKGNHVEHWLNGNMVLSYEKGDAAWNTALASSKFKNNPTFATATDTHILLQDHGNKVSFRNLKIREIK
jgi:hypothetical protein